MDILIPYVDSDDPSWRKIFMAEKGFVNRTPPALKVLFAPFKRRFSSYGLFKYWWRALDANYKNINKIHLLLMQESQFPKFLNPDDPRIAVHYHRDFMPARLLPCFNSASIELCALLNLGLTGNILLSNDDMYFNQPCDDTLFVDTGKPKAYIETREDYGGSNVFRATLRNGKKLVESYINREIPYFEWHHLFQVYDMDACKGFLDASRDALMSSMTRQRQNNNINHMALMMYQNAEGIAVHDDDAIHRGYIEMHVSGPASYNRIEKEPVICINDVNGRGVHRAREYLTGRYPSKCSFEI